MCIKHHEVSVCRCKNLKCPSKDRYLICCPYAPRPDSIRLNLCHLVPDCTSYETACDKVCHQAEGYAEVCSTSVTQKKRDIGLCIECQNTCAHRQSGVLGDMGDYARLMQQRLDNVKRWGEQILEWRRAVDSDTE